MPYPYIEVHGTAFEMGRQHGRQAAGQIAGLVEYLARAADRPHEEVLRAAGRFEPLFREHCPALLEEVRGLAQGAEIRYEEALLLQIRGEVSPLLREEACTTFALSGARTREGGILLGQNSDMGAEMEQFFLVLRLVPKDGPRTLIWTLAGQLGYHGLNEHGVAHFANSVSGGPTVSSHPGGLPHYPVKRRLYECRTQEEVLRMWKSLPVCSSGNYMLSAGDPVIFDVEATPGGPELLEDGGEGFLAHANHFLAARLRTPETDAASLPDSFIRQERMTVLLREQAAATVEDMKAVLSDHHNHPCSICRHEESDSNGMSTVAGLIAEPQAGRLHVSRGNPCRNDWTCYEV